MLTTTTKSNTHTYGYITRAFNRRRERLIHRQRLTSVDRQCSTIFFLLLLLLHCVLTFGATIYLMQVYARMYIDEKEREKKRKKVEHKPRKTRPKQETERERGRMHVTLSFDQILNMDGEHCSGVYTRSLSFSVIIIIVQRERGGNYTHEIAEKN